MPKNSGHEHIQQSVSKCILDMQAEGIFVTNDLLATEVRKEFNAADIEIALKVGTKHLCRKGMYRKKTRGMIDNGGQDEMFAFQEQYPVMRNGEKGCMPLFQLTLSEFNENIARLRKDRDGCATHANELEELKVRLLGAGFFTKMNLLDDPIPPPTDDDPMPPPTDDDPHDDHPRH